MLQNKAQLSIRFKLFFIWHKTTHKDVYWFGLGWSQFSSQQPVWYCVVALWPESADNTRRFLTCAEQHHSWTHPTPPAKWLRVHKKLGGYAAGIPDSHWPKGYPRPHDIMLSDQSWGKKVCGCGCVLWHLPSQVTVTTVEEMAKDLPTNGKWGINSLFFFACTWSFALLIKLPLSQPAILCLDQGSKRVVLWDSATYWG